MAKHKHGEMDISEQEKTYVGFVRIALWTIVAVIAILIFLALANA